MSVRKFVHAFIRLAELIEDAMHIVRMLTLQQGSLSLLQPFYCVSVPSSRPGRVCEMVDATPAPINKTKNDFRGGGVTV